VVERLRIAGIGLLIMHSVGLVTWVTVRVFGGNPPDISPGTATALAAVYGLPALSYGITKARSIGRQYR